MRIRLILSFALIVLVSVTLVAVIARQSAANEVRAFMFRGGMTGVEELVDSLEDYYTMHQSWRGVESLLDSSGHPSGAGQGNRGVGQGMMHGSGGNMMNQRLRLADAMGNLVADTEDPQPAGSLSPDDLDRSIRLQAGGQTVGYLLPEGGMGFSRTDERLLLNRLNRAALTAGLIAGGLSLLLALLLAYTLLRPVHALTRAAGRLGQGDLTQRVAVHGDDELAVLGNSFNAMAGSLQRAEESRRAVTADIAHELRNPLAVQRANLEAMQDGVYPLRVENLQPILEQNILLTRLVDDLRTLALAESGQLMLARSPTDFPALVRRVLERFRPQSAARQINLEFDFSPTPLSSMPALYIDPDRVEQILGNLLSNALRYTPESGRIKLILEINQREALLSVQDSGQGIPPEALDHLFERFYRADRSRSRAEGGSGLGLAIARQLAEAHGGSLTAANHPNGGAVFTLTLPV